MSLLISPKLIPCIECKYSLEWDKRIDDWVEYPSSDPDPVTIQVDSGVLHIEGEALTKQLKQIVTIYRNAGENIGAVPKNLLTVDAIAEVGFLRSSRWDDYHQEGLILQMADTVFHSSGLVDLTPEVRVKYYSIVLFEPVGNMVGFEREYDYDDIIEREFGPYYS